MKTHLIYFVAGASLFCMGANALDQVPDMTITYQDIQSEQGGVTCNRLNLPTKITHSKHHSQKDAILENGKKATFTTISTDSHYVDGHYLVARYAQVVGPNIRYTIRYTGSGSTEKGNLKGVFESQQCSGHFLINDFRP